MIHYMRGLAQGMFYISEVPYTWGKMYLGSHSVMSGGVPDMCLCGTLVLTRLSLKLLYNVNSRTGVYDSVSYYLP